MILAIETATNVCATALISDGTIIAEHSLSEPHVHSEKLLSLIDDTLTSHITYRTSLNGIAVSIGPGSFTGLRIGLSVAKGLCYAWNKPLVPVPTLQALAWNVLLDNIAQENDFVLPMLDARRSEAYVALYQKKGSELVEVHPVRAISVERCLELILGSQQEGREYNSLPANSGKVFVLGDASTKFRDHLEHLESSVVHRIFLPAEQQQCRAASVGLVGEKMLVNGITADLASLEPMYVKEFFTTAQIKN